MKKNISALLFAAFYFLTSILLEYDTDALLSTIIGALAAMLLMTLLFRVGAHKNPVGHSNKVAILSGIAVSVIGLIFVQVSYQIMPEDTLGILWLLIQGTLSYILGKWAHTIANKIGNRNKNS